MYRDCPICGNSKVKKIREISMCRLGDYNPLPLSYYIVCCDNCGFAYADTNASQKEYDAYYRDYNMYADNVDLKVSMADRIEEFDHAYSLFSDKVSFDANIIDIGCGNGDFLGYLQQRGFKNLCGMDPSESSIEILKKREIKSICSGIFDSVEDKEKYQYDIVISMGVIEHIYDLKNHIRQVIRYMRKDKKAYFLCICPSVEGFMKDIHAVPNYFNQEHINFFSKISLDNLLNQFGLFRTHEDNYFYIGSGDSREQIIMALYETRDEEYIQKYDELSEFSIRGYFEEVMKREMKLESKIEELLSTSKTLIIWGCGAYAMQLLKKYPRLVEKAAYFIDNNPAKQGIRICGKMVRKPESVKEQEEIVIAICSMMNASDIEEQIKCMMPKCSVVTLKE